MEQIKDTINSVIRSLAKKKKGVSERSPQELLKKILTKKEFEHIRVSNFTKGVLYVEVDSSTWLYYLGLRKKEMLARLAPALKGLKNIRFSLGEIRCQKNRRKRK